MRVNNVNVVWQEQVHKLLTSPNFIAAPRGQEVREILSGQYRVPMPAYLDLSDRNINLAFMFAEAAWIISGSNRLSDLTPYMKTYANFSDDGVFLRGAYGPKVVDQLGYVVDALVADNDSRQAVMTMWRERPAPSKDIPCTLAAQFVIRDGKLNMIMTMRSHDIVLGFTYDVFTFSMIAASVRLLLRARGIRVELGDLYVTAGSLHLYERHYEQAEVWVNSTARNMSISKAVNKALLRVETYEQLIDALKEAAQCLSMS